VRIATRRRGWWIGLLSLLIVLIGLPATGPASAAGGKPHSPDIPASARAALLRAATAVATSNGDSHPYDIEALRTSHRKAERILDTGGELYVVPPTAAVYVVAMRGHFNCNRCSGPPGVRFGAAGVITLQFLDLRDLQNFVFGFGGPYPHLKAGGATVRL
jgi:hypothetical protein